MKRIICALAALLLSPALFAAQPAAPARPVGPVSPVMPPGAIPPDPAPIDAATLEKLYQQELGPLYTPQVAPKLLPALQLLEKYFAARKAVERADIVKTLEATGLDAAIIGRLAHIRLYWPSLKPGIYYVNERIGPHSVIYFLGIPAGYDRGKSWPLVIKLPGAHPFVKDPPIKAEEVVQIYSDWIRADLKDHPDAVTLMPMLNLQELWGPSYTGMNSVYQPLLHVASRVNIDPSRVYMLGHGMSGHATWNLAIHYPTYFAAIDPIAGGVVAEFQWIRLDNLRNIYSVVWHDADDKVIKVDASRNIVKLLQKYKYDVDYEESKLLGHAPARRSWSGCIRRCAGARRELYPRQVVLRSNRPDSLFNRNDWVQVFQPLESGGEHKARFELGSGLITMNKNEHKVTATVSAANRINVLSQNVESMRFFLNEQMIDMSKPVMLSVNGKVRFQGMVKPNIDEMLKDQVFLGRGWRYYTGLIDIDFGGTMPSAPAPTSRPKGKIEVQYSDLKSEL